MGDYLKLFETHNEYQTYINGQDVLLPNVSYCEDNNEVHYNPIPFFVKLHLNDDSTILIEGNGQLTPQMTGQYHSTLTSIEIGGLCTSIADGTFANCPNLTSATISNSVVSIGNAAFSGCTSLTSITIPNSVTSIGYNVFSGCLILSSITVDDNNYKYDSRNNCNAIIETSTNTLIIGCKNTVIPDSVTTIYGNAFVGCTSLTSITIPNSVTSIGSSAFDSCSSLTTIISFATTAPTISMYTFRNVKTNGTLYVPSGSTGYNEWMKTNNYYLGLYGWAEVEQ